MTVESQKTQLSLEDLQEFYLRVFALIYKGSKSYFCSNEQLVKFVKPN